jgi:hypothetical protein
MVLRNLKKDILCMQIPTSYNSYSIAYVRDRVITKIDETIKRKDGV